MLGDSWLGYLGPWVTMEAGRKDLKMLNDREENKLAGMGEKRIAQME